MKTVKKTFSFDLDSTEGLASYNVYYGLKSLGDLTYESEKVNFPIISNQLTYSHILPSVNFKITEGEYIIGVSTLDAEGNETDIVPLEYQFDFIAPTILPKNLKIT
jgi:hypothetical protein